jgi:Prolyl oligopeptidase, N-terminal beta-propeller domain
MDPGARGGRQEARQRRERSRGPKHAVNVSGLVSYVNPNNFRAQMGASPPNPTSPGAPPFHYPPTRKSGQVDDYHGTRVEDPYRWLEEVDSPETRSWVEAQNAITFAFLEGIPARPSIHRRLTELWNHERFGVSGPQRGQLVLLPERRPPEPGGPLPE